MKVAVSLIDDDDNVIGTKTFNIRFAVDDPRVWFTNVINWLVALLQPYKEGIMAAERERLEQDRAADEAAKAQAKQSPAK